MLSILGVLLAAGSGLGYYILNKNMKAPYDGPIWHAGYERMQVTIVERGTLESSENSEILCRVKAGTRGAGSTVIKWVIDDGTHVEKGQKLVEFDDSALQELLRTQTNTVNKTKAEWVQADENYHIIKSQNFSDIETAKTNLKLAEIDLKKYLEGDFALVFSDIQGRLEIARSDLEQWLDRSAWSQRMMRKGYLSRTQAESDKARLDSADIGYKKVQQELSVLEQYTKMRNTIDLENKLAEAKRALDRVQTQTKAKLSQAEIDRDSKRAILDQEEAKKGDIEDEIRKCVIYSPQPGLVVYYVPEQSRSGAGSSQAIVAQGEPVRESQKLMRIPNLAKMMVVARVHEAMVSKLRPEITKPTGFTNAVRAALTVNMRPLESLGTQVAFWEIDDFFKELDSVAIFRGQNAAIRIDAFPAKTYSGHVKAVANVASQTDFFSSDVKVYPTTVSIDGAVEGLKPGMSAEVTILADEASTPVLTVPVQAVVGTVTSGGKRKLFVLDANKQAKERDVLVGLSNDKMVEIREGLAEGEQVVLNPKPFLVGELGNLKPGVPGGKRGADIEDATGKKTKKKGPPAAPK